MNNEELIAKIDKWLNCEGGNVQELLSEIRSFLATPLKAAAGWRPIEDAPHDKYILVTGGTYNLTSNDKWIPLDFVGTAIWMEEIKCFISPSSNILPKYWQPLPPPPQPSNAGEEI